MGGEIFFFQINMLFSFTVYWNENLERVQQQLYASGHPLFLMWNGKNNPSNG